MNVTFDATTRRGPSSWSGTRTGPCPCRSSRTSGKWRFDAKEGREEILARRIGGNELDAIDLLRGYVEAQQEYASEPRDGSGVRQYAQKFISTPGKQDGLSWRDADGKPGGPHGRRDRQGARRGLHGQDRALQRLLLPHLTAQGPAARLGARDYVVKGMMIGGFAAIAWPANYGVTGHPDLPS